VTANRHRLIACITLLAVLSGTAPARALEHVQATAPKPSVFVTGRITNPGEYYYEDDMTVQRLLEKAGGVSSTGSTSGITITRLVSGRKTKLEAILSTLLQPDDVVSVPKSN
jgi:protein involved in polysaccharide export with SLBB domain